MPGKTVSNYLLDHARAQLGFYEPLNIPAYESLCRTEWSKKFEALMRNRLIVGAMRYGLLNAPGKRKYNRVDSIIKRLEHYKSDRNAEHLIDAATLSMLEFEEGDNVLFAQDDGEHVQAL